MTGRVRRVVLMFAASVVIAGVAAVLVIYMAHPRDEAAFIDYVHTYGNYDGKTLDDPPSEQALLEAGDHACDWLNEKSPALWRDDPEHRIGTLQGRYDSELSETERSLPKTVTAGAWTYLCPATQEFIRPHRPFGESD